MRRRWRSVRMDRKTGAMLDRPSRRTRSGPSRRSTRIRRSDTLIPQRRREPCRPVCPQRLGARRRTGWRTRGCRVGAGGQDHRWRATGRTPAGRTGTESGRPGYRGRRCTRHHVSPRPHRRERCARRRPRAGGRPRRATVRHGEVSTAGMDPDRRIEVGIGRTEPRCLKTARRDPDGVDAGGIDPPPADHRLRRRRIAPASPRPRLRVRLPNRLPATAVQAIDGIDVGIQDGEPTSGGDLVIRGCGRFLGGGHCATVEHDHQRHRSTQTTASWDVYDIPIRNATKAQLLIAIAVPGVAATGDREGNDGRQRGSAGGQPDQQPAASV